MPYRVDVSGVIECDTATEAVELQRKIAKPAEAHAANGLQDKRVARKGAVKTPEESPNILGFLESLNENGQKLIRALTAAYPTPLPTDQWAERAGLARAMLGPMIKHIYSTASKNGLDVDKAIFRTKHPGDAKYKYRYQLDEEIVKAVKNWNK